MGKRLELQKLLEKLLGSRNVYYQPPASIEMKYPAIVYSRRDIENTFANNKPYLQDYSYELTVIDANPDSMVVQKISRLPMCSFNRHFALDGLNHDVFTLYF